MSALLIELSIAFGAINLTVAGLVIANRFLIRRTERRYAAAVARLKPLALDWIEGEGDVPTVRSTQERRALADLLCKYGRSLTGDGRARITQLAVESGLIATLTKDLRSRRAWRRAEASFKLGDLGADQATQLAAMLGDRSRSVRNAAARSLGKQGAVVAVADIVDALSTGAVARAIGGQALIEIGASAADELAALLSSERPEVRAVAAELLGRVGRAEYGRMLAATLHDEDPVVRVAAVRALGRLGGRAVASAVPEVLDDPEDFVRAAAATALGKTGRRDQLDRLLQMAVEDSYLPARAAAAAAMELDPARARTEANETGSPHLLEIVDLAGSPA